MLTWLIQLTPERIGHPSLGWIIPGFIMLVSIGLTILLYKKFSSK